MAQIERSSFGLWSDGSKGQFAIQRLDHRTTALRAKGGVVNVATHHRARDHHEVLLHIGVCAPQCAVVGL